MKKLEKNSSKRNVLYYTKTYNSREYHLYTLSPLNPAKFVWHTARKCNRASILENGLLTNEDGFVYANNQNLRVDTMYNIVMELYESFLYYIFGKGYYMESVLIQEICEMFDFWRIDVKKTSSLWYIDPDKEDIGKWWHGVSPRDYILTTENIPSSALALYKYDASLADRAFVNMQKGVIHYSINTLPLRRVHI